jgi:hypothetical protein
MACEEKARLVAEYGAATKKFSGAVAELQRKMGTSPKSEYERLSRAADDARVKSEQARLGLEQHIAAHGC